MKIREATRTSVDRDGREQSKYRMHEDHLSSLIRSGCPSLLLLSRCLSMLWILDGTRLSVEQIPRNARNGRWDAKRRTSVMNVRRRVNYDARATINMHVDRPSLNSALPTSVGTRYSPEMNEKTHKITVTVDCARAR